MHTDYVLPEVNDSDELEIIDGRHPVIERLLPAGEKYIPNDTKVDTKITRYLYLPVLI